MTPDQPAEQSATPRTPKIHTLKVWPPYFQDVLDMTKTFELRHDDRDFQVGDTLHLQEYDPSISVDDPARYTGRELDRQISYVMRKNAFLPGDYVCLGLWPFGDAQHAELAASQAKVVELESDLKLHIDIGVRDGNEIAALRADLARRDDNFHAIRRELSERDAELAAARKDAERYRWLCENQDCGKADRAKDTAFNLTGYSLHCEWRNSQWYVRKMDIDNAIDAANRKVDESGWDTHAPPHGTKREQTERRSGKERRVLPYNAIVAIDRGHRRASDCDRRKAAL